MVRHRAATVCPRPGCANDQPCELHTRKAWESSDRAARLPKGWQATRRRILKRDRYACQACGGELCGNQRLEVDHIVNNDDHPDANLRTIGHNPCHTSKTQAEAQAARLANRF